MDTVARQLGSIQAKWKHTCLLPFNTGGKLIMARVESTTPNILGANAMRKRHWMQFCLLCCQVFSTCRSPVVSVVRQHDAICAKPGRVVYVLLLVLWVRSMLILFSLSSPLPTCCPGLAGWCSSTHPSPAGTASCPLLFLHHYHACRQVDTTLLS